MEADYRLDNTFFQDPREYDGIRVSQIGRLFVQRSSVIREHLHTDLFELTVVGGGQGTVTTNGVSTQVRRGDIYFNFPGDRHRIESSATDPLHFDFWAFTASSEEYAQQLTRIAEEYRSAQTRVFRDERIGTLLSQAIDEINSQAPYAADVLGAIFRQMLVYTLRFFGPFAEPITDKSPTNADVLCYKLMHYVDTHLYSLKDLREAAAFTGYSYGYLTTFFKEHTGVTLFEYCHGQKMEAARKLILAGRDPLSAIAEKLNYSSAFALSKSFRAYFGCSPREYKNSHLKSSEESCKIEKKEFT